jgi:hypothetical protein
MIQEIYDDLATKDAELAMKLEEQRVAEREFQANKKKEESAAIQ